MKQYDGFLRYCFSGVPDQNHWPWDGVWFQAGTNGIFDDEIFTGYMQRAADAGQHLYVDVEEANLDAYARISGTQDYQTPVPGVDGATEADRQDHIERWRCERLSFARDVMPNLKLGIWISDNDIQKSYEPQRQERQRELIAPDGRSPGLFALCDALLYGAYYINSANIINNWCEAVIDDRARRVAEAAWNVERIYMPCVYYWDKFGGGPVEREKIDTQLDRAISAGYESVAWCQYRISNRPWCASDPYVQVGLDRGK